MRRAAGSEDKSMCCTGGGRGPGDCIPSGVVEGGYGVETPRNRHGGMGGGRGAGRGSRSRCRALLVLEELQDPGHTEDAENPEHRRAHGERRPGVIKVYPCDLFARAWAWVSVPEFAVA